MKNEESHLKSKIKGKSKKEADADFYMNENVNNAIAILAFSKDSKDSEVLVSLADNICDSAIRVYKGNLREAESILISQAKSLDSLFSRFTMLAASNTELKKLDPLMRIALRAQNQCRATLQTLSEIKNPRQFAYVQQANISNGHQQVNNGVAREENNFVQNKLSGGSNELLKDERASQAQCRIDKGMGTMEEINRSKNSGGQGQGLSECLQGGAAANAEEDLTQVAKPTGGTA